MSEAPQKPTLWQRLKTNAYNFTSHALGYIPRGILLTGLAFAVSSALGTYAGMDFLGINYAAQHGLLLPRFLGHLALGSAISGVIGATLPPCPPCQQVHTSGLKPSGNPLLSEQEVQLGQKISQGVADQAVSATKGMAADAVVPGAGTTMQVVSTAANLFSKTTSPAR